MPETSESEFTSRLAGGPSPDRTFLLWCGSVFILSIASVAWLAVRAESPSYVRSSLDFLMHVASGAVVAFLAFRALFLYPFRLFDLLTIVFVLSLGMKLTIDMLHSLSNFGALVFRGLPGTRRGDEDDIGGIFQICLIVGSILLLGGAWGLRNCRILKLEGNLSRAVTVAAGMLVVPAAAGFAVFPVLILSHVVRGEASASTTAFGLLWLGSIIVTVINAINLIKGLTLTTEIQAQEKLP